MVVFCYDQARSARAGGWGPLLGEPCSGYTLGKRVLEAVTAAHDGIARPTQLTEAVLRFLSLQAPEELIDWAYRDLSWSRIATLSRLVFELYGIDDVATQIVDTEVSALLDTLEAAVRAIHYPAEAVFPVVCSGGNFTHENSLLYRVFGERLAARQLPGSVLQHARVCLPSITAEQAAALLARSLLRQPHPALL
jgi:N-acetylglucosamine kinase-like BadF-type ATPase